MSAPKTLILKTSELDALNRELATIFACPPAKLTAASEASLLDGLVLCGVLGGKNVGKSTLINALAGHRVSVDQDVDVRGTDRPVVYVHQGVQREAANRLSPVAAISTLEYVVHDADAVRNLVLVDLPDFDSEFRRHVEIARQTAPLLDRIIWVATPRKLGDRAWLEMLASVIKHARNVHCVLNKVDELLSDADPFLDEGFDTEQKAPRRSGNDDPARRFYERYDDWLERVSASAGCSLSPDHRFLIAAGFSDETEFVHHIAGQWEDDDWKRFGAERENVVEVARMTRGDLDRLRNAVMAPLVDEEVRAIKEANRDRERAVLALRMRDHYELDRTLNLLEDLCAPEYAENCLRETFDGAVCAGLLRDVEPRLRSDRALADELLESRVDSWPLLRIVHWPLGWLARAVGRRVTAATMATESDRSGSGAPEVGSVRDRIELLRARLCADAGAAVDRLRLEREIPDSERMAKQFQRGLRSLPQEWEEHLLDDLRSRYRRPSILTRAALWLVTLWFPLLQPVSAGLLEMFVETGTVHLAHGAYRLVTALSAAHLLAGFGVVAGIYVVILAAMYSRALRSVRRALDDIEMRQTLEERLEALLRRSVLEPMLLPFAQRLERLSVVNARLTALTAGAEAA